MDSFHIGGAAEFISERYHSLSFATCSQNSHCPLYSLKVLLLLLSVTFRFKFYMNRNMT